MEEKLHVKTADYSGAEGAKCTASLNVKLLLQPAHSGWCRTGIMGKKMEKGSEKRSKKDGQEGSNKHLELRSV